MTQDVCTTVYPFGPFAQKYADNLQLAMMPCRFIKGFEISRSKLADMVGSEQVDAAIQFIVQDNLDRDGFKYLACGTRPEHEVTRPLVIVLDDDDNLEVLKGRSLGDVDLSILRVQDILEGPDVWERSA